MLDIIAVVIKLNTTKVGIFVYFGYWSVLEQCLILNRRSINMSWVNEYYCKRSRCVVMQTLFILASRGQQIAMTGANCGQAWF